MRSATLHDAAADPQQVIADLKRQLTECRADRDQRTAERDEALAQQAAAAEVLQVINASPGNLAPVFDAMLEKAMRLCEAAYGILFIRDGELFHGAATKNLPPQLEGFVQTPFKPSPDGFIRRAAQGQDFEHIRDLRVMTSRAWGDPRAQAAMELGGARTMLSVPLRKESAVLGAFNVYRTELRPFTEQQIAVLQNFGTQAVIAMENARLLGELRQRTIDLEASLEYQTATSDLLKLISRSTFDLHPVLGTLVETAVRLCSADSGHLTLPEGEDYRTVAAFAMTPELEAITRDNSFAPGRGTAIGRALTDRRVVQIEDIGADSEHAIRQAAVQGLVRTVLAVPLLREGEPIGALGLARSRVEPFTDRQIELVRTFADQAVIAIENTRLITETREALEQQTATAEVLQVINSSPGDLAPVFDAMLEKALNLCGAAFGILLIYDGDRFRHGALHSIPAAYAEFMREHPPIYGPGTAPGRLALGERLVHVLDMTDTESYRSGDPNRRAIADLAGARTLVAVPLRKDNALLGAIVVFRQEVRPFSDKQVALLQNFAAQAVIAMENARLITETREALEQQTATAEVLGVINSSPGDLTPVFDAMLEKAMRLCDAAFGTLAIFDGTTLRTAATRGVPPEYAQFRMNNPPVYGPKTAPGRFIAGERLIHNIDLKAEEAYREGEPNRRALVDIGGARSALQVALRRDDALLGSMTIYRQEVRPFSEKQIALMQNFAAQAVIAMENARLITETREALEQQTATSEVLQVINSSPGDLEPVFDAMLERATRLCEAVFGVLVSVDGERIEFVAQRNVPERLVEFITRQPMQLDPATILGRAILERRVVHTLDNAASEAYRQRSPLAVAAVELGSVRTILHVPLLKDDRVLGIFIVFRQEVKPYSEKQIALLQNFAAQAVIAMENARLIIETREALEQQTATAEVLQVINSSPGDLAPVFDAMLQKATRLCDAAYGLLATYDANGFRGVAAAGLPMDSANALSRIGHPPPETALGQVETTKQTVQIVDISAEPVYQEVFPVNPWLRRVRTNVVVPLLKETDLIGAFIIFREEVRPFTDKQVTLLQSFAAQAVIAIDNARLLNEIRQRQAELRVTFDNMGDGVAMFDHELRLIAWNRHFQELLQLPDALLTERPAFDTYIRFLTERGEFGDSDPETEIARLRSRLTDQYATFERTRPDGTVMEIRNNPMPDGGVVVIYSDITERKRSEEEMRAARDAAETAYAELKAAQASLIQA